MHVSASRHQRKCSIMKLSEALLQFKLETALLYHSTSTEIIIICGLQGSWLDQFFDYAMIPHGGSIAFADLIWILKSVEEVKLDGF